MNLTTEQRKILAHVVVAPDEWWMHAQATAQKNYNETVIKLTALDGTEKPDHREALEKAVLITTDQRATIFLTAKLARWKPIYDQERIKDGYKPRAEREIQVGGEMIIP